MIMMMIKQALVFFVIVCFGGFCISFMSYVIYIYIYMYVMCFRSSFIRVGIAILFLADWHVTPP